MRFVAAILMSSLLGCSSNGGGAIDASADAPLDAARGNCDAGEVESQGDWTDWDSTDQQFMGIFDAEISEGANASRTAPNGRAIICLAAGADHTLAFSHPDYLPMSAALDAGNLGRVYSARGLTPARADDLFSTELGLTRDPAAGQIHVQLPAGATANIDTTAAGEVASPDASYAFFANVPPGGVGLTVTPPSGQSCTAVDTLDVTAGVIAFTAVSCN